MFSCSHFFLSSRKQTVDSAMSNRRQEETSEENVSPTAKPKPRSVNCRHWNGSLVRLPGMRFRSPCFLRCPCNSRPLCWLTYTRQGDMDDVHGALSLRDRAARDGLCQCEGAEMRFGTSEPSEGILRICGFRNLTVVNSRIRSSTRLPHSDVPLCVRPPVT